MKKRNLLLLFVAFFGMVSITMAQVVASSSEFISIFCNGGLATVTVSATGGTAPYTGTGNYSLPAGTYGFNVIDSNGNSDSTYITVTQPAAALALSTTQVDVLCNGNYT